MLNVIIFTDHPHEDKQLTQSMIRMLDKHSIPVNEINSMDDLFSLNFSFGYLTAVHVQPTMYGTFLAFCSEYQPKGDDPLRVLIPQSSPDGYSQRPPSWDAGYAVIDMTSLKQLLSVFERSE